MAYIYKIVNDINDKIYIGKTEQTIEKRFKEHCQDYKKERNEKRPLYAAMRKYGIEHFHISLVEKTDNPEEREKYWIEQYRSFKNGYNATKGGDGKAYIDYDLVIATYLELKNISATALKLHIHQDSVSNILRMNDIEIIPQQIVMRTTYGKIVNMYDLSHNFLRSFPSISSAATYMIENNLTNCKHSTIKQHISEVCTRKRRTAAKFIWEFGSSNMPK